MCCGRGRACPPVNLGLINDLHAGVPRDLARDAAVAAANDEHLLGCFLDSALSTCESMLQAEASMAGR